MHSHTKILDQKLSVIHLAKSNSFGGLAVSVVNSSAVETENRIPSCVYFLNQTQHEEHRQFARKRKVEAYSTSSLGLAYAVARSRLKKKYSVILNIHSGTSSVPEVIKNIRMAAGRNMAIALSLHGSSDVHSLQNEAAVRRHLQLANYVDMINVPSELEQNAQISRGIEKDKVTVVPDIVRISDGSRAKFRSRYHLGTDELVIGFCGRLEHSKGILETLRAMKEVRKSFPDIAFVVAGIGRVKQEAEDLDRELGAKTRFLGHIEETDDFYAGVDIVVLPSAGEAFGTVALEAALSETPMALSAIRPWTDWLRPGIDCEMFSDMDPAAIANSVLRLANDPDLRQTQARSAKQRVNHHFSSAAAFERLAGSYATAIARNKTRNGY